MNRVDALQCPTCTNYCVAQLAWIKGQSCRLEVEAGTWDFATLLWYELAMIAIILFCHWGCWVDTPITAANLLCREPTQTVCGLSVSFLSGVDDLLRLQMLDGGRLQTSREGSFQMVTLPSCFLHPLSEVAQFSNTYCFISASVCLPVSVLPYSVCVPRTMNGVKDWPHKRKHY